MEFNLLIFIISILGFLVIILGYTTFNLMRKNEKAEDLVVEYLIYLDKLSRIIEISDEKLKKIDSKGHFKSDDEVGFFFEQIKSIQEILNQFKIKKQ